MSDRFARHRIAVGNAEIFRVAGGDGPPVLMLPGFPQTHALWARIAPDLVACGYRVICSGLRHEARPGGHFFPDLHPGETAVAIARVLDAHPL